MSKKSILYVDDDPDDRQIFIECMEGIQLDVEYIITQGGHEAIKVLKTAPQQPSCIFVDMNMPLMTGREFVSLLKANPQFRNIPCYILSTSYYEPERTNVLALGVKQYLIKPNNYRDYCNLLHTVLENIL